MYLRIVLTIGISAVHIVSFVFEIWQIHILFLLSKLFRVEFRVCRIKCLYLFRNILVDVKLDFVLFILSSCKMFIILRILESSIRDTPLGLKEYFVCPYYSCTIILFYRTRKSCHPKLALTSTIRGGPTRHKDLISKVSFTLFKILVPCV